MDSTASRVKIDALLPGMRIEGIVGFSSEYSYLDSGKITQLKERFRGAKVILVRNEKRGSAPIEALASGDQLTAINGLADIDGFGAISPDTAEWLKTMGFREFLVTPGTGSAAPQPAPAATEVPPAAAPPSPAQPGPAATLRAGAPTAGSPPAADAVPRTTDQLPVFASARGLKHKKTLAQIRYFLDCVAEAENARNSATEMIQDMFQQGRASKYSITPAREMVEDILRKDVGSAMAAVSGLKASDQTYAHCIDMAVIFNEAASAIIKASGKEADTRLKGSTLAAGFMHDIGKTKLPQDILDSTERFEPGSREMELMRSHVTHSAQILSDIDADKTMVNVALYHHVKMDTTLPASYPEVAFAQVMPMTRLAAIVDVYQALTGKRSYKKNWVPGRAVQYLRELESKEFDPRMLANFLKVIGLYPVGSLVRLSTGDLAYVIKVEGQPIDRPVVAVVENASGELLSVNPMADLVDEQDVAVVEVVDHYEHYNASLDQPYEIFKTLTLV